MGARSSRQDAKTPSGLNRLLPELSGLQANRARILLVAGLIMAGMGSVLLTIQSLEPILTGSPSIPLSDLMMDALTALAGGAVIWLVRSGRLQAASAIALGCLLLLGGVQMYWEGSPATGISGPLALLAFISMAMVLLERGGRWLAFLAAVTLAAGMTALGAAGWLPASAARNGQADALFALFSWLVISAIVAAMINATTQALRSQADALQQRVTELQAARETLAERSATLHALFNAPMETVALITRDGCLISINESGARRLGGTPEELVGRSVYDILPPELVASRNRQIDGVFETGEPAFFEDSRAGMYFANSVYPVYDETGERVRYVAIYASDITERVRMKTRMRESEERYRQLFDSMHDGFALHEIILDASGKPCDYRFKEVNPAFERLTGLKAADILGKTILEVMSNTESYWIEAYGEVALTGRPTRFERYSAALDKYFEVVAYRPSPNQFATIFADVSERIRAEGERALLLEQVQDQAEQIRQIVDTMPEGVIMLDTDGRLLMANPAGGAYLAALAHWETGEMLAALGDQPLRELMTSPPQGLWHEVQSDGRVFQAIARPLESGPQNRGWVLVLREVTREREIQEQMQRKDQLAAIGQLAAGIAHDFNNIMSVIIMSNQRTLRDPSLSSQARQTLETAVRQAFRATGLINQILDFSRQSPAGMHPTDLLALVKEEITLLERTLPESNELHLTYQPKTYIIQAVPVRVQQLLMNLAVNARDAIRSADGGTVSIALSHAAMGERIECAGCGSVLRAQSAWVKLAVADSGSGIPADVLPHIFRAFFTTKPAGEGTGLGLAQVLDIAHQHQGHIAVESRPGEGTTFTVYFPAASEPAAAEAGEQVTALIGGGKTLLIVEDNESLRQALVDGLEPLNYRVLQARSGREALELLSAGDHDVALVLTDMVMPEMGGSSLVNALREAGNRVPVISMSGYSVDWQSADMSRLGVAAHIKKPINLHELSRVVLEVLDRI